MRTVSILPVLLLILLAGCEKENVLDDRLQRSSIELTDGYCLMNADQVVLNHHDIEHYDYGTHLIYLKDHISTGNLLEAAGSFTVIAGGEEIYTIGTQPGYSSFAPSGPIIWTHPTFYPDHVIAIDLIGTYEVILGEVADSREDPRIVKALKKYGQYYEGLHCEIISMHYSAPGEMELQLELTNRDEVNYYYLDPEKMGMGLFHYFTNGLVLWDEDERHSYSHETEDIQPDPWDTWNLEWMSLLEGGNSVRITMDYSNFETLSPGTYQATFQFPGLGSQVDRDDLAQRHGRIWLGQLRLKSAIEVR